MPLLVWIAEPNGDADYFNQRWYEYTGVHPEESGWQKLLHPDDVERTTLAWTRSLRTGEPCEIEFRLRWNDGSYHWLIGRILPIRDARGRIEKWIGTCSDIQNRREIATSFGETEQRLETRAEVAEAETSLRTEELGEANRALKVLAEVAQIIIHADQEEKLFEQVSESIVQAGGYKYAWIGLVQHDKAKRIVPFTAPGIAQERLSHLNLTWSASSVWGGGQVEEQSGPEIPRSSRIS